MALPTVAAARLSAGSDALAERERRRPPPDAVERRDEVLRAPPAAFFRAVPEDLRAVPATLRAVAATFRAADFAPLRADDDFFAAVRLPPRDEVERELALRADAPPEDFRAVERLLPPREPALFLADVLREELRAPDFLVAMRSSLLKFQTRVIPIRLRVLTKSLRAARCIFGERGSSI